MPNHRPGATYSLADLVAAFHADPPTNDDPHFLLFQGEEILALCLRYKYNPDPNEVWVGDAENVAAWGKKLVELKDKKTLPLYYCQRGRTLYEYKDHHLITGETTQAEDLAARKSVVPLSRVVFIKPVERPKFS
jgi:hypothetical protein